MMDMCESARHIIQVMYERCVPVPVGEPADLVCMMCCRAACLG